MSAAGHYQLGVDLGTTWTAAAVARGQVGMVGLGNRAAAIPSVIHRAHDGSMLIGDAADRRGPSEPLRVAREFKRRLGDPTPVLLGGTPCSAEALLGMVLDAVVTHVAEREGGRPDHLTVTHPANWGPYKIELFEQAVRMAGVPATTMLTEPEAAAAAYAANERLEPGALVAVYDLGGGTFDTAILRKTADGFVIVGQPAGIERLGGIDFDEAVIGHVRRTLGGVLDRIDPSDPAVFKALWRLRRECIDAKEALSSDSDATIPVLLPEVQTEVRLTRGEFEAMIRPTLHATIDALRRTLAAAAVEPAQISTVLLVGGSSRIPAVGEMVSEAFGLPIAVDAHPKHAVALGAAHAAARRAQTTHGAAAFPVAPSANDTGPVRPSPATADHASSSAAIDDTADLSAIIAAGVAARTQAAPQTSQDRHAAADMRPAHGGGVALAERELGSSDAAGRDDGDIVPAWLREARDSGHGRSSRRWTVALVAFVVLSVLTVGAGAFMTSEPRSEAFGDTSSLPAPEPSADTVDGSDADPEHDTRRPTSNDADGQAGDSAAPATGWQGAADDAAMGDDADTSDAADGTDTTSGGRTTGDGGAARDAGTTSDGGAKPAAESTPDPPPGTKGGGDPQPESPGDDGGDTGPSEPAGGGGGDGGQQDPQPEPDPGPSAGDDGGQQTPQASENPDGTSTPATQA